MALSWSQQPDAVTVKGQRLIFTALSTNTTQTGFRYKVTFAATWSGGSQTDSFYIPPNPNGYGIIDMATWVDKLCYVDEIPNSTSTSVHLYSANSWFAPNRTNYIQVDVDVEEAWVVDGVLTDSPTGASTPPGTIAQRIFAGYFQPGDGYDPPLTTIQYTGNDVYVLTKKDSNNWKLAGTYGLEDAVAIPARQNSWGCWAMLDDGSWDELYLTVYDADGVQIGSQYQIPSPSGGAGNGTNPFRLLYAPFYPQTVNANVFAGIGFPDLDAVDWAYYTFEFYDSSVSVSKKYVLYKVEDCRYDNVHIGWTNPYGGWDYFDFDKKRTYTYQAERKRYKKVLGNFASTYSHNSWDRGMTEFGVNVERYIEVTKGNMTNADYELLVDLVRSENVHIVPDGASPVIEGLVLENRDYVQEVIKRAESKEITMRFRYANDLW